MAVVQTQEEADHLNETGEYGPYRAANGHLMVAPLKEVVVDGDRTNTRPYRVGDEIQYSTWNAWCADTCDHRELGPLEDW